MQKNKETLQKYLTIASHGFIIIYCTIIDKYSLFVCLTTRYYHIFDKKSSLIFQKFFFMTLPNI